MTRYYRLFRLPSLAAGRSHFQRQYYFVLWASFLGPMAITYAFGFAAGKGLSYFIAIFIVCLFAPLIGIPDLVFTVADWMDARRKIEIEARRRRLFVAEFGDPFRKQLTGLGFDELFIMGGAIVRRRPAFTRAAGDRATEALMKNGFVRPVTEYRPDGFPLVFVDLTWTLMQELAHEVLLERDRKSPMGNQLELDHIPDELFALFPDLYHRPRDPVTAEEMLRRIGAAISVRVGIILATVAFVPVAWALMLLATAIVVGGLIAGGWAVFSFFSWMLG